MLICSLTQTPTPNPVLSLRSKCIFDSQILKSYIEKNGKDPINNEIMTIDDLIPIASSSASTTTTPNIEEIVNPSYSSIPTMLTNFQNYWDALSLELFNLKNELDKCKKELSLSLYRQDAAVKVAVNACKERDDARYALAQLINDGNANVIQNSNASIDTTMNADTGDVDNNAVDDTWNDIISKLREEQERLLILHKQENKERKGKSPIYEIETFNLLIDKSKSLTVKNKDHILGINLNDATTQGIVTYNSGLVELIDFENDKTFKCISKSTVKDIAKTSLVSFWMVNEPYILSIQKGKKKGTEVNYQLVNLKTKEAIVLDTEIGKIKSIVSHPTLPIFLVFGGKEFELFYDFKVQFNQQLNDELESIKFHTDGLLIGLSYLNNSTIDIYDLSERLIKLNIETDVDSIVDFKFAHNGYYLLICSINKLLVFDMRKNMVILESPIEASINDKLLVDLFTSIVIIGDNFATLDKKGKSFTTFSKFNQSVINILNDNSLIVSDGETLHKAKIESH